MASKHQYMSDSANRLHSILYQAKQRVLDTMRLPSWTDQEAYPEQEERLAFGEEMADRLAQLVGKWTFILSYLTMHQMEQHILGWLRRSKRNTQEASAGIGTVASQGKMRGYLAGSRHFIQGMLVLTALWFMVRTPRQRASAGAA